MEDVDIIKLIASNSKEYIQSLRQNAKGEILLRAFSRDIKDFQILTHNINDRKPRDTPLEIHNILNDYFEQTLGWKIRNGAFCYGYNVGIPTDARMKKKFCFAPLSGREFLP